MEIRFLGHAAFELTHDGTSVLIDPFLTGNPMAAVQAADVNPDVILLTHGHVDHLGDTVDIARRTGAPVVAIVELANEIQADLGDGHQVFDPNIGGTVKFDWGWVKLTPAWHTGTTPNGIVHTPAGLLVGLGDKTVYHLGDTALFSDLKLIAHRGNDIDVALIPIGGHYTMDRYDGVVAAEWIGATTTIPCHYDTFPPIRTDAQAFKADVQGTGASEVVILAPGETHPVR
jgi:L-ascorbate metabolism protein UlaG (beta-lactamase superfamily)